jgi:hypothetical protein
MARPPGLQSLEDKLTTGLLVGAAVASVVTNVVGSIASNVVGFDAKWYLPVIFLALYGIFRRVADAPSGVTATFYRNNNEFYASSQRRMQSAQSYIWVTYVRLVPPPGFDSPEARSYFQYCLDWARRNPDREFRRMVGAPTNAEMRAWLRQHHADTKSIKNYLVRVMPSAGEVDTVNVGIIDGKVVFLTLSEEGHQNMTGHSIEIPESVQAFKEYYLRLWSAAEPLESYVSRVTPALAVSTHPDPESR